MNFLAETVCTGHDLWVWGTIVGIVLGVWIGFHMFKKNFNIPQARK